MAEESSGLVLGLLGRETLKKSMRVMGQKARARGNVEHHLPWPVWDGESTVEKERFLDRHSPWLVREGPYGKEAQSCYPSRILS